MGRSPTLRDQQRAFTRDRLIEAGRQVFAARGYPETTVDDIAREAGASRATFYLHFRSKGDVMAALVDDWVPFAVQTYDVLDELLEAGGPELPERLRAWLAQWAGHPGPAKLTRITRSCRLRCLSLRLRPTHVRLSEALVDALTRCRDRTPPAERAAARNRALILEMMTQRIFALASLSQLPIGDERLLDILTTMWMGVLAADRRPLR